jgi:Protein of unknown function (DUF5818)
MKQLLPLALLLAAVAGGMIAQNRSGTTAPDPQVHSKQRADTESQQSARAFHGRIIRAGHKFVLREASSQTSYQLDDQDKAKRFEGKNVEVVATLDPDSNSLYVVEIASAQK